MSLDSHTLKLYADTACKVSRFFLQACEGEERNMILMPRWEEEPYDNCIEGFVETLLSATDGLDENTDLRESTRLISLCLGRADNS